MATESVMAQDERLAGLLTAAWEGRLAPTELIEACSALEGEGRRPLAAILYQAWLRRPQAAFQHLVWFNLGATLAALQDARGAIDAYGSAIAVAPNFIQPRLNLGLALEREGRIAQAGSTPI